MGIPLKLVQNPLSGSQPSLRYTGIEIANSSLVLPYIPKYHELNFALLISIMFLLPALILSRSLWKLTLSVMLNA